MAVSRDDIASSFRVPHGGYAILSRYALVLDTVANAGPGGLPLADIGQLTKLPQATVYRLVHALVHVGFLMAGEQRRHYVIGSRLLNLICVGVPTQTIHRLGQPILDRLAAEFGETAFVSKLKNQAVETLLVAQPGEGGQSTVHPGRAMPFHAAASAKAILAFADETLLDKVLSQSMRRFTSRTKTSKTILCEDLALTRERGFAVCDEELYPGVIGYACPVRVGNSGVIYSLGLVGFRDRLTRWQEHEVITALKAAAEVLGRAIRETGARDGDAASALLGSVPQFAERDHPVYDWTP